MAKKVAEIEAELQAARAAEAAAAAERAAQVEQAALVTARLRSLDADIADAEENIKGLVAKVDARRTRLAALVAERKDVERALGTLAAA